MKPIAEGQYVGKVTGLGWTENKKGDVQAYVNVSFKAKREGRDEDINMTWFGSTSTEKSTEYTTKTLGGLGIGEFQMESRTVPEGLEARIIVIHEPDYNTGEPTAKIKYLNGVSKFKMAAPDKIKAIKWSTDASDDIPF